MKWKLPLITATILLASCQHSTEIASSTEQTGSSSSSSSQSQSSSPVCGPGQWPSSLDQAIKQTVTPRLLQTKSLASFCPNFTSLSEDSKRQVYADILWAVSKFESSRNPCKLYHEKAQGKDSITGQIKLSEGLMQLSFSDVRGYPKCQFEYLKDKKAHLDDLAKRNGRTGWHSENPNQTILDPVKNLSCAVHIFDTLTAKYPSSSFHKVMGKYWSVIRDKSVDVIKEMKTKNKECWDE